MVSKVFEKFVYNRVDNHLEKCGLFLICSMILGPLDQLHTFLQLYLMKLLGLLTCLGLLEVQSLIYISKNFDRVWHAGLLHKLKSYGISGQIFGFISSFLSSRRLRVALDGKSSQEYQVNAGVLQGCILGPTLFLLYINDLPDDIICDIAGYADDTTLYSNCVQASYM